MSMNDNEAQSRDTRELSDYLRVIRERLWVIPITVAVVLGITLAVSVSATPQYRCYARLYYEGDKLLQQVSGLEAVSESGVDQEVRNAGVLLKLEPVAADVAEALGEASPRTPGELLDMVSVQTREDINVVDIYAVSDNAQECADVANAFANQFALSRQQAAQDTLAAALRVVEDQYTELLLQGRTMLETEYGVALQVRRGQLSTLENNITGGFRVVQPATNREVLLHRGPFATVF
jgi:capsular polysaccharide biosynthesis protein